MKKLESEIRSLQRQLYALGRETNQYSSGEILKLSKRLDEKIILHQKMQLSKKE
ncbi:Spo0E family sporulation regulatory protein-aspartic acid phosphatase [Gracilibacillus salinarum]|uniref:Spo0E family sporulation regulatory protein-aspartic acid phosphatase n=1 Tax=Gracilibacillus salinarum TaxID=2932255 RepID=A0ABY4GWR6_9BACI|nr:Spo0E family sporulation regulatory protein-aspartic acid phosphatase [Gracilibacillus salinarum]UOQ87517.1 Spo0E family sporulation regulatory protein-aspartic acid phosphatase [Gracilibacillus salinarum]